MKKAEIRAVLGALKQIRMPKIEDKELRNAIIANHFDLFKIAKAVDADIEALRASLLAPYEDELREVDALQSRLHAEPENREILVAEINSHTELQKAVDEFNKAYEEMMGEEIELKPIDAEKFVEEYQKQDYDMTVVEALWPMFK